MTKPLFFQLNSRLGLLHAPYGHADKNVGVEEGPRAILTPEFLDHYPDKEIINIDYPKPEEVDGTSYLKTVYDHSLAAKDKISATLAKNPETTAVFLGGDHSVALNSFSGVLSLHNPDETLVIMLDSHADLHQPETSPSGNFHGMWLRVAVDQFSDTNLNALIPAKLPAHNLIYIGNLDIEPAERKFIEQSQIKHISHTELNNNSGAVLAQVQQQLAGKKHLHISLDVDAISKEFAPATGMPCADGLKPGPISDILSALAAFPSKSLDIVEFNPRKDKGEKTKLLLQKLIRNFL